MTEENEQTSGKKRGWRRWALFGVPITGVAAAFIAGIIFWGGFNTAMEATNTPEFCVSCHEMRSTVYPEYKTTVHYKNATGVRATCSDCHVPDPWIHKMIRKVEASRELVSKMMGTIDTPEKFAEHRLRLAGRVWKSMKNTDSRECRNCHNFESMAPEFQVPRARQQHLKAIETGQTCIDCHKGIAHESVRHLLSDEVLEELEKPMPEHIRKVPQVYLDSLAYITALEAEQAAQAAADAKVAEEGVAARIAAAVDAARAEEQAKLGAGSASQGDGAAVAPATGTTGTVAPGIDWNAITPRQVTLFYPGQASFEWVQNGKEHGGARPFTKGGERCSTCHAAELKNVGTKIVTGTKLEPTPIPGKRPVIDVALQAAHDDQNLYLRLQWHNGPHTPVPFVEGGKMDPEHQIKVAMMIAGKGIERVEQAGCWVTCHNDNLFMPDAPDAGALASSGDLIERLGINGGVTKYLSESRTEIELKGKDGKPLGGWDKLKSAAEIEQYVQDGTYMDLLRVISDGTSSNGHILEQRLADGGEMAAEAKLEGDLWTVVLSRPLNTGAPGDVTIEPGTTYTVGFAIHDDYTAARFHHVSLEFTFALDDAAAEINVVKP